MNQPIELTRLGIPPQNHILTSSAPSIKMLNREDRCHLPLELALAVADEGAGAGTGAGAGAPPLQLRFKVPAGQNP